MLKCKIFQIDCFYETDQIIFSKFLIFLEIIGSASRLYVAPWQFITEKRNLKMQRIKILCDEHDHLQVNIISSL